MAEALDNVTRDVEILTSEDIKDVATTLQSIVNVESAIPEVKYSFTVDRIHSKNSTEGSSLY